MLLFKTYPFLIDPRTTVMCAQPPEERTHTDDTTYVIYLLFCRLYAHDFWFWSRSERVVCVKLSTVLTKQLVPITVLRPRWTRLACMLLSRGRRQMLFIRSTAATILCHLSVWVSGQIRKRKGLYPVLDFVCVQCANVLLCDEEYFGLFGRDGKDFLNFAAEAARGRQRDARSLRNSDICCLWEDSTGRKTGIERSLQSGPRRQWLRCWLIGKRHMREWVKEGRLGGKPKRKEDRPPHSHRMREKKKRKKRNSHQNSGKDRSNGCFLSSSLSHPPPLPSVAHPDPDSRLASSL